MNTLIWIMGAVVVLILIGSFVSDWIYEPPIDPPVAVIKRRFGVIEKIITGKGWILVLPYIHSVETHELTKFEVEVKPGEVLTPDNVSLSISVTLYLKRNETEEGILALIKSGNIAGVKKILNDISEQEIRQWARSDKKPTTWQEAQGSQDDLVKVLKKKIVIQCGGSPKDETGYLPNYGVFLNQVTIGEIFPLDETIRKEKELKAGAELQAAAELTKVELQKKSVLVKVNTELDMTAIMAEKLGISKKEAYEVMKKYEAINGGHGGIYQVSLTEFLPMAKAVIDELRKGGAQ